MTSERASQRASRPDRPEAGWPTGMPYTVRFPEGIEPPFADLEHAAPLPRIGDTVEYIDEHGVRHRYRVTDVVHTLQSSPADRPSVDEGEFTPASLARADDAPEGPNGSLRAGLPTVVLKVAPDDEP